VLQKFRTLRFEYSLSHCPLCEGFYYIIYPVKCPPPPSKNLKGSDLANVEAATPS
jgi:hypothetical protein